jgi:DNA-binding transcriptional regulator YdaS (Cro superfamily)
MTVHSSAETGRTRHQSTIENQQRPVVARPETYDPDNLLNAVAQHLQCVGNDAMLSRALDVGPPVISKIRTRRIPVGATVLIRMHEVTNYSIRELRDLMGDRRAKWRFVARGKNAGE